MHGELQRKVQVNPETESRHPKDSPKEFLASQLARARLSEPSRGSAARMANLKTMNIPGLGHMGFRVWGLGL